MICDGGDIAFSRGDGLALVFCAIQRQRGQYPDFVFDPGQNGESEGR
jgi:hypothetical protein